MNRRYAVGIGLILSLVAAVSCGTDNGTTSPKAIDGVLLRVSDLPEMRLVGEDPVADAAGMAELLQGDVFKDEPPVATAKLKGFGFKRGYGEVWDGAGLRAAAFAAGFDTADHAKAALDYMNVEVFRECPPGTPYCFRMDRIKSPGIPDFVGQKLTPLRPPQEGRQEGFYKFLFGTGAAIYGIVYGADEAYDPGSVSQTQGLALVQRLYERVKNREISDVLRSAPPSPLGPPHGPPPEESESPPAQ